MRNKKLTTPLLLTASIFLIISCQGTATTGESKESQNGKPAAIVVDAETGEPIEGAVAIAFWRKPDPQGPWWEVTGMVASRVEEAVSNEEGMIYIDDFWDWKLFEDDKPALTVYKPGYVCWDQKYIFPKGKRTDFGKENRVVRVEKWKKGYSYIEHEGFILSVTHNETLKAKEKLFESAFNYEERFRIRERNEINKQIWEKRKRREQ